MIRMICVRNIKNMIDMICLKNTIYMIHNSTGVPLKVVTRSEPNADVLLFSEGGVVPCAVPADSSLLHMTMQ